MTYSNNTCSDDNPYMTGIDGQGQDTPDFDYPEYSDLFAGDLPAASLSDWTFSPSAWQGSPYIVSSVSSAGVSPNSSWNPFDQSFTSIQTSIDHGTFVTSGTSDFSPPATSYQASYNSNPRDKTHPYLSLDTINETNTLADMKEEGNTPRSRANSTASLPSPTTNFQSHQPVSGPFRLCCRSSRSSSSNSHNTSKTITTLKRRKSLKKEACSINNRTKSDSTPRLRSKQSSHSTIFASASSSTCKTSSETTTRKGSRINHNDVEKQYRNRLNNHFETLLQSLPKDVERDGESKVSKSEVLVLATQHIKDLESERSKLEKERAELEVSVEQMKRRWFGLGGVCLP